jgi:hypothetical protein
MSNTPKRKQVKLKEEPTKHRLKSTPGYQQSTSRTKRNGPSTPTASWANTLRTTEVKPIPSRESRSTRQKDKGSLTSHNQQRVHAFTRGTQTPPYHGPVQTEEQRPAEKQPRLETPSTPKPKAPIPEPAVSK